MIDIEAMLSTSFAKRKGHESATIDMSLYLSTRAELVEMSDRLAHGKIELMPVQLHFKQVFKHGPGRRGAPLCQYAGQVGQSILMVLA